MAYSAVYYGKVFDYKYTKAEEFSKHVSEGGNWYYRLMFGNLSLTNIDTDDQRNVQGKATHLRPAKEALNNLFYVQISATA